MGQTELFHDQPNRLLYRLAAETPITRFLVDIFLEWRILEKV